MFCRTSHTLLLHLMSWWNYLMISLNNIKPLYLTLPDHWMTNLASQLTCVMQALNLLSWAMCVPVTTKGDCPWRFHCWCSFSVCVCVCAKTSVLWHIMELVSSSSRVLQSSYMSIANFVSMKLGFAKFFASKSRQWIRRAEVCLVKLIPCFLFFSVNYLFPIKEFFTLCE